MAELSWIEKLMVKLTWGRVEKMIPGLKRYLPLLGVAVLVGSVVLRYFGHADVAGTVESVGGVVGATQASPVSGAELTAAVAAGLGVILKIVAEVKKEFGPQV